MKLLTLIFSLLVPIITFADMTEIVLTKDNTVVLNGEVDAFSVAKVQQESMTVCGKNEGSTIYLVMSTPGGSVMDGKLLIDTIKSLPCKFDTITLFAASMGYQIAQNLGTRYIIPSGTLMSHRMLLGGIGGQSPGELESRLNFYARVGFEMDVIAAGRAGISVEEYRKLIVNELWLTGEQAVQTKHADEIAKVRCGKDMNGTKSEILYTMFGPVKATFSDCPLIQAPLSVEMITPKGDEMDEAAKNLIKEKFSYNAKRGK